MAQGSTKKFGTAFDCMDGRCQKAVAAFMQETYGVDYVDAITEPGIDGILAGKTVAPAQPANLLEWIKFKADVSVSGHGSARAVVVGHLGCAGNGVSEAEHEADIAAAVGEVESWHIFETVVGLLAFENADGVWQVREVLQKALETQAA